MKNKFLVAIIVVLVIALVIAGIYLLNSKEKTYENVRILSDDFSNGTPNKIIYNDKEYKISKDDQIYSIKNYEGKLYYYKFIDKIGTYFQEELEIADMNSIFYEFGEIILNEEDLTYTMKPIKKISYTEYENGNKEEIEYCVKNDEKYGLEIKENI